MPIKSSLKSFTKLTGGGSSNPKPSGSNEATTTKSDSVKISTGMSLAVRREDSAYSSSTSSTGSERVAGNSNNNSGVPDATTTTTATTTNEVSNRIIDEMGENLDQMSLNSVEFAAAAAATTTGSGHRRSVKSSSSATGVTGAGHHRNSIRDSVGELNQLMLISSGASIGSGVVAQNEEPNVSVV